jgi:hypothetical protein
MAHRQAGVLALVLAAAGPVHAAELYPFAGVFSVLEATAEEHYEMTKFTCLASLSVQRADGTYTAYHLDTAAIGKSKVLFHPYETGACEYSSAKKTEHCKTVKSNWGIYDYYIEHRGEKDGAFVQATVDMRNPTAVTVSNMRKCPFDEAHIRPFLSEEWQNLSDEDLNWVLYRHFPFNPDQAKQVAKTLGLPE